MRFKELLQIVCFLTNTIKSDGHENIEIIHLLTDFLVKLNTPVKISAYVCWLKDEQIYLWKQMSSHHFSGLITEPADTALKTSSKQDQIFFLDANCNKTKDVLNKAQQLNLFHHPYKWIVWYTQDYGIFENVYLRIDSQVYTVQNKENKKYYIKSLYKLSEKSSRFIWNDVAEWEPDNGFLDYKELIYQRNRSNLMGININISYVLTNPDSINHLEDYRHKHIDSLSKHNWKIFKHVISVLNATSSAQFSNTWGYKDKNTSRYTGMIGHLTSGAAEFGGTALFFTPDRIDIIDYVAPSVPTFAKFIFRAPPISYVSNVFTLPFDNYVWYSCFLLIPLMFIVVYIIVMWEWRDPIFKEKVRTMNAYGVSPLRPSLTDVLLMEFGAITQQGTDTEPKSNAGRIATVFAFIAFMFLYTSYCANIVAILQSTTESIKTLEDLLNSRITLGVEDIVYAHYYFENAQDPVRKAIYQQKVAPNGQKPNFMPIEEGISRMQNEFFAFHVEVSSGYKIVSEIFKENEKCSLKEIQYITINEPWISIKKNSEYKKHIKISLRKIAEAGIQQREKNKLYTKKPSCQSTGSNFGSAGILDCYAAFLIFGVGLSISIMIFIIEKLVHTNLERVIGTKVITVSN